MSDPLDPEPVDLDGYSDEERNNDPRLGGEDDNG
jgi:hypothetical protein